MEQTPHRNEGGTGTGFLRVVSVLAVLILGTVPSAYGAPPAERTYFTILLGFEDTYSWQADCLSFTRTKICNGEGECGTWMPTESGPDGAFTFEMELEGEGAPVRIEGLARFEARGRRDAIGGAGHATHDGRTVNFAFNGRSTGPSRCRRLVENFLGVEQEKER